MSKQILIKSVVLVFLICSTLILGCDFGTGRNTGVSKPSESNQSPATSGASLNDKVYKINYELGYKVGMGAAKDDKKNDHSYSPETILANPLIQTSIRTISDQAVAHFGETYRQDAERGYKDGFLEGYKEGYK